MKTKKKIVIIGATSAIAIHCARLWAREKPSEIILVGRSEEKIKRIACDLKVRSPDTAITSIAGDLLDSEQIQFLVSEICNEVSPDIVLIAHGTLPNQSACQYELKQCEEALVVNGISPVLFAEAFAAYLEKANSGTLAVIGSVAGDRGRKSNYVYGAAKGLLARYTQGLQHRFAKTNVKIVLIKPGPTDTPMTVHLRDSSTRLASAANVARDILRGIDKGQRVIYTPSRWGVIMMIIRHIPYFIFKEINI